MTKTDRTRAMRDIRDLSAYRLERDWPITTLADEMAKRSAPISLRTLHHILSNPDRPPTDLVAYKLRVFMHWVREHDLRRLERALAILEGTRQTA
jgi:hypothetical protein